MDTTLIEKLSDLRSKLSRELQQVCTKASSFFSASLLGFILSIIMGIVLALLIISTVLNYARIHHFNPDNPPVALIYQIITLTVIFSIFMVLIQLFVYYTLSKFMNVSIKSFQTLLDIDERLSRSAYSRRFIPRISFIYPPFTMSNYPRKVLLIAVLNVPLTPILVYTLMSGLLLGNMMNIMIGGILACIMLVLNIYILYMVYRFFNALGEYYGVEKAETIATLLVVVTILSYAGMIPKIGDVAKLVNFVLIIIYLVYLHKLVDELRESYNRIMSRLNDIIDGLKEELKGELLL